MNIPMVNSIRLIHTAPPSASNVKKSLSNQDRADNLIMNKEYCLKLIAGGERDLDKLSELVGVNRTTIKKYLKFAHANAIVYDARDDSYIVSGRHQDAVFKFARETGELIWILGPPDNWKEPWSAKRLQPIGDLQWQYREHGPVLTGDGTLLMYDNGGGRAGAYMDQLPLEERYSRAVEYAIDEEGVVQNHCIR